jgi:hypothetical protein
MTSDAQSTGPRHRRGDTDRSAQASMRRDAAPVICAELLLHHGFTDPAILSHLARTWRLDEPDLRAALAAAHILLRRQEPHHPAAANE